MNRNFFVPSLCFLLLSAAANLLANWMFFSEKIYLAGSITVAALGIAAFIFIISKISIAPKRRLFAIFLILAVAAAEYILASRNFKLKERLSQKCALSKVLSVTKQRYSDVAVIETPAEDGSPVLIQAYAERALGLSAGDVITFRGSPSANGISPFNRQLLRRGINYSVGLNAGNCRIENKAPPGIREKIRRHAENIFKRSFSTDTAALLNGLYFNDRNNISKLTLLEFRRAGVMHVLAASGLHVGIIAALPIMLSALFAVSKTVGRSAAFVFIAAYLFIANAPVSLLRAALMFLFLIIQRAMFNERNPFNILFWAGTVILIIFPHELFSLGFQLSFGATSAILIFFRNINELFSFIMPAFLRNSLSLTVSVNIVTAPIIALTLKEANYNSIIGNLTAIPIITIFMDVSIIAVFVSTLSEKTGILFGYITDKIYECLRFTISHVSRLPAHFSVSDEMTIPLLVLSCIMTVIALMPAKNHKRIQSALLCAAMLSGGILLYAKKSNISHETIQLGESCKIVREMDEASIVGSIKGYEYSEKAIEILNRRMVRKCSLYIVNPDYENILAFSRIVKQSYVNKCVINGDFYFTNYMRNFFALLEQENVKVTFLKM